MLSKAKTRRWQRIACFIALPVATAFAVLWVTKSTAHKKEQNGNIVTFGPNRFELGYPAALAQQTAEANHTIDSFNRGRQSKTKIHGTAGQNQSRLVISTNARLMTSPQKMNGEKIYASSEQSIEVTIKPGEPLLPLQLVDAAKNPLAELPDGRYEFNATEMIVDKSGRVVYYTIWPVARYEGMISLEEAKKEMRRQKEEAKKGIHPKVEKAVPESVVQRVTDEIERFLDNAQLVPASKDGNPIVAKADYLMKSSPFIVVSVKNHEVSIDHP